MRIFATSRATARATPAALARDMQAEIDAGQGFYRDGLIVQAYMDADYTRTFMVLEAASVAAAKARFDTYPQVRDGLIEFEYVPLVGLPAIARVHEADGTALPAWWPAD